MPLLYPFSVKIHTKKRSANGSHSFPIFVCESELFLLIVLLHDPYQLVFVADIRTYYFTSIPCKVKHLPSRMMQMCPSRNIFWKEDDKLMSLTRVDFFLVERKFVLFCFLIFAKNIHPYSKMCELCELCELLERKIPPQAVGFSLFIRSRIYSLPSESLAESDSAFAESCDFFSEPKRAARA